MDKDTYNEIDDYEDYESDEDADYYDQESLVWEEFGYDEIDAYGPISDPEEWYETLTFHKRIIYRVQSFIARIPDWWRWNVLRLCRECHKPDRLFGRYIGKHDNCLPF